MLLEFYRFFAMLSVEFRGVIQLIFVSRLQELVAQWQQI